VLCHAAKTLWENLEEHDKEPKVVTKPPHFSGHNTKNIQRRHRSKASQCIPQNGHNYKKNLQSAVNLPVSVNSPQHDVWFNYVNG